MDPITETFGILLNIDLRSFKTFLSTACADCLGYFVVFIGACLGSFKAQDLSGSGKSKFINTSLGIFTGVSLALHYKDEISIWGASILSLIAASLAVVVIDTLFKIMPEVTPKLTQKWLGIELDIAKKEDHSE